MKILAPTLAASTLGSAMIAGMVLIAATPPTAPLPAQPTAASTVISDDDPRFNCLTMGNRRCGPIFKPVGKTLAKTLKRELGGKSWRRCLIAYGDTTVIVCPDGRVETS